MTAFYLDEMFPQATAVLVRRAGVDVLSSHECGHDGMSDHDVLLFAGREGRAAVTDNHRHFIPLTRLFYERNLPHAGVVLVPSHVGHHRYGLFAAALVRFAREHPDGLQPYEIRWLNIQDV